MTPFDIGLIALAAICVLVFLGLYVPIALMLCSFVGVWAIKGNMDLSVKLLGIAANHAISSYFFGVIPLFVFMGFVVSETGLGRDAFDVANAAFKKFRGGLAIGTVGANAIFAAITGVSIASAAVFSKIAVPEMIRHGYGRRFSVGVVAGSSVLGMLIPPSLLMILYGLLAEQSIGDLFIAGVVPGMLLALAFAVGIVVMSYLMPGFVGSPDHEYAEPLSAGDWLAKGLPIALLVAVVLGGIYGGYFTPVEAGAVGSIGALLIAMARRAITFRIFWRVLVETGLVTATICFLLIAAQMYSRMLAFSGVPAGMGHAVAAADLSFTMVLAIYLLVLIALGMILDSSSILLIIVPIMLPVFAPMGVDLVWFGVVTVIAVEIGLLTPPFGLSVYVIKGTLEDRSISLGDIFLGAAPFALIMLLILLLVAAFPQLALVLVN
ncbi:MAG: C4-dicarboxylate ABC transporter permease [Hyphomicrobiales bacterium]|nr:MAG: C4-dicarboxylate ABC transporter permease [Hyphomicrobiales bacterium]